MENGNSLITILLANNGNIEQDQFALNTYK